MSGRRASTFSAQQAAIIKARIEQQERQKREQQSKIEIDVKTGQEEAGRSARDDTSATNRWWVLELVRLRKYNKAALLVSDTFRTSKITHGELAWQTMEDGILLAEVWAEMDNAKVHAASLRLVKLAVSGTTKVADSSNDQVSTSNAQHLQMLAQRKDTEAGDTWAPVLAYWRFCRTDSTPAPVSRGNTMEPTMCSHQTVTNFCCTLPQRKTC